MKNNETLNVYEKLRQKMDRWPTRAPKSREIIAILQELFTPQEAELLTYFKAPLTDRASPRLILILLVLF